LQVSGDVLEAGDLFVLRRQVRDRVADEVGELEPLVHLRRGEVAEGHPDVVGARLGPQLRRHGCGQLDPVHGHAALAEGQREPTGADAELERCARSCQIGEEAHRRVDDRRIGQVRPEVSYRSAIRSSK